MSNPFVGYNEALATATSNLDIHNARALIDWVDNAPGAAELQAAMWTTSARRISEKILIAGEFAEALHDFAATQARQAERIREVGTTFRRAHSAELRRINEPKPGEDKWDISRNPAASSTTGSTKPTNQRSLPTLPEGYDTVQDVFDYGYCNALALALHERTGWPILGLHARGDAHPFHYLVRRPDGLLLDAHGARTQDDVLQQWGEGAPEGYYAVQEHTQDRLWADVRRGDMEDPADVWPLAQAVTTRLVELPVDPVDGDAAAAQARVGRIANPVVARTVFPPSQPLAAQPLGEGSMADVELLTYPAGTRLVHKLDGDKYGEYDDELWSDDA
ncbi:hypothetical protein [Actinosynnema sp. NPDC023587]|uniref:hypothetical protein n=1 Tax=Actinosynnema sp. NPDC023587 TaxID=3154695 RepID=UPI003409F358